MLNVEKGRPWELYDIEADRNEQRDLVGDKPALVGDLRARFESWARSVGVEF